MTGISLDSEASTLDCNVDNAKLKMFSLDLV